MRSVCVQIDVRQGLVDRSEIVVDPTLILPSSEVVEVGEVQVPTSHSRLSFILAGGLMPTNIRAAIDAVHPWAVDVFFGVEQADAGDGEVGVGKDPRLVKRFVYAVRGEEEEDER